MLTLVGLLALAGRLPAGSTGIRRVSWFNGGGGWTVGIDGLNYSEWVATNRAAITGVMPCCGCWAVEPTNGTFYATGRCASKTGSPASIANWATAASAGLTIEPTGGFEIDYILGEGWAAHPGSLATAMAMLEREGWSGFGIDNENYPPSMPPALPTKFGWLLGNLSLVAAEANRTVVVDVTSTWTSDIGGPEYLPGYGRRTPTNVRYMDMAEYFAQGHLPGGNNAQLVRLKQMLPLRMIAPAVGLTEMPGHRDASCGGWPQCTNFSDPACGCIDYGWNRTAFAVFVRDVEAAGITEIDIYRQDMTPPPGTIPSVPPWLIAELAGFLARGEAAHFTPDGHGVAHPG